ncbi:hypothetical protein HDG32_007389 [Paraburkholderia sp. CI2]|uniref:polymorphic toxin type 4 domain-containing protein n=1 Tax=Paraburkholderia sp. CI2 TaxID=2723093 RepID=UPI001612290F|nr:polymorphic toxin type 4 domain-containing protein [Paraburkholderia sp. CI2]MBB5471233.1 hypothetical protein [Paraburkholderia sp. CI2]
MRQVVYLHYQPPDGEEENMHFSERTFKDALGATVIQSRLGLPQGRQGYEKLLFPGIEVGLAGWQRSHSQGGGTGFESPHAIRYAPEEVNQQFQRLGIERYLRELVELKPSDTELWLTTVTMSHPRTLRLKEIQYRVDAVKNGLSRKFFEASIEVSDQRINPKVIIHATPFMKTF